ncbi:unnamed protein product [Acanthoscelides obtectus]|uniref:DNA-3-methyladenine glycosylase n=1 Tax=Acanthoscelides obtectus TaxID=200917 RepID=A0A9P0LPT2_ACAOB|nr:unnamed protein product [Acanthoscelides obtectus]CAH1997156.1 unnamed protein product [Acanthoscelides obtectus]CAK1677469.1 DNA-3-methyladenine glycosylase [Acanthoscelides obtectus]CAK1677595.1 DNA-3-methyladenine glycosylase [Acanthoscelides obtectus]
MNSKRLLKEDLDRDCKELAVYLLGKVLVRKLEDDTVLQGRIVETESYLGTEDKASHSYNNRRSAANEPMYMEVGTCYVYMTYGMFFCMNISSREPGAAVLIRALEPLSGIDTMEKLRVKKLKGTKSSLKIKDLCNGPAKLCNAMNITKEALNKVNIADLQNEQIWLEDDPNYNKEDKKIVQTSRIGIASAGAEWAAKPLRYYILNNECVSKRDKTAERNLDV